jgi:DNA-binding NarL/FixJ family response regulator
MGGEVRAGTLCFAMRILLCDDHALFRDGLELVLDQIEGDLDLVGVGDAEAALLRVRDEANELDLVLLDIALPGMNGFDALPRLRREHPEVPVVVLSASERPEDVRRALDGGAAGFISKSTRGSVLVGALRLVLSGGVYSPPLMLDAADTTSLPPELTPRQVEVLRLLA